MAPCRTIAVALGARVDDLPARNLALRHSLVRLLQARPELLTFIAPDIPLR